MPKQLPLPTEPHIDLIKLFPDFQRLDNGGIFPSDRCVVQSETEDDVFNSLPGDEYICVVMDKKSNQECIVNILRPYISNFEDAIMYGWIDLKMNFFYDHCRNGIHNDNIQVVAWKRYE